ncbi:MAG: hypothetical protein AAF481_10915 [Acidobacteriota bacterium]
METALFPLAYLTGSLELPRGVAKPTSAVVEARQCDSGTLIGVFPFTIDRELTWRAAVPAGCAEFSILDPDFAPVTLGSLSLPRDATHDVGRHRWTPGGSLLIRVTSTDSGRAVENAEVLLLSDSEVNRAVELAASGKRLEGEVLTQRTDAQGWTRFRGLPADPLSALAISPEGAFVLSNPMVATSGTETLLELEIEPPGEVTVAVTTAAFEIPEGVILEVLASGSSSCEWLSEILLVRALSSDGTATFSGLHPGTWLFWLNLDGPGGDFTLAEEHVEVLPGQSTLVPLQAQGNVYSGEITWLDEPVSAKFQLLSHEAETQGDKLATSKSGDDGAFQLVLREAGTYDVDVWIEKEGVSRVPEVEFTDPQDWVEIELPGGAIEGTVEDSEGKPIPQATIYVRPGDASYRSPFGRAQKADELGRFRAERLAEGEWQIKAIAEAGESDRQDIDLAAEQIVSGVVLTIREGSQLRGQMAVGGQGIANIPILVSCSWTGIHDLCGGFVTTESQGAFSIDLGRVPDGAFVNLLVRAAGYPTTAFRRSVDDSDVVLELPTQGGRLSLVPVTREWRPQEGRLLLIRHERGGIVLGSSARLQEAVPGSGSGSMVFPNLAPGSWTVFRAANEAEFEYLFRTGAAGAAPLATVAVAPGSSQDLLLSPP